MYNQHFPNSSNQSNAHRQASHHEGPAHLIPASKLTQRPSENSPHRQQQLASERSGHPGMPNRFQTPNGNGYNNMGHPPGFTNFQQTRGYSSQPAHRGSSAPVSFYGAAKPQAPPPPQLSSSKPQPYPSQVAQPPRPSMPPQQYPHPRGGTEMRGGYQSRYPPPQYASAAYHDANQHPSAQHGGQQHPYQGYPRQEYYHPQQYGANPNGYPPRGRGGYPYQPYAREQARGGYNPYYQQGGYQQYGGGYNPRYQGNYQGHPPYPPQGGFSRPNPPAEPHDGNQPLEPSSVRVKISQILSEDSKPLQGSPNQTSQKDAKTLIAEMSPPKAGGPIVPSPSLLDYAYQDTEVDPPRAEPDISQMVPEQDLPQISGPQVPDPALDQQPMIPPLATLQPIPLLPPPPPVMVGAPDQPVPTIIPQLLPQIPIMPQPLQAAFPNQPIPQGPPPPSPPPIVSFFGNPALAPKPQTDSAGNVLLEKTFKQPAWTMQSILEQATAAATAAAAAKSAAAATAPQPPKIAPVVVAEVQVAAAPAAAAVPAATASVGGGGSSGGPVQEQVEDLLKLGRSRLNFTSTEAISRTVQTHYRIFVNSKSLDDEPSNLSKEAVEELLEQSLARDIKEEIDRITGLCWNVAVGKRFCFSAELHKDDYFAEYKNKELSVFLYQSNLWS